MDWTQFSIFLATIAGIFLWNRSESNSDRRATFARIDATMHTSLDIQVEIRDVQLEVKQMQFDVRESQNEVREMQREIKELYKERK